MQRAILGGLRDRGPTLSSELCWLMAEEAGKVSRRSSGNPLLPEGGIVRSFYVSFTRALRGLVRDNRVGASWRRLRSADELVTYYPFKTQDLRMRLLRERLLPHLRERMRNAGRLRFSRAENEVFIIEKLTEDQLREATAKWSDLEGRLVDSLAIMPSDNRRHFMAVWARGCSIFPSRRSTTQDPPLGSLIAKLEDLPRQSKEVCLLASNLIEFYVTWFPREQRDVVHLKSLLAEEFDLGEDSKGRMRDEFKRELHKMEPDFIESLPGDRHRRTESEEETDLQDYFENRFSPLLDQLVRKDVFRQFTFLTLSGCA